MSGRVERNPPPRREDPAGRFIRGYRAALLTVGLLVVLNPLLVQPSLFRVMTDAPLINVAGRQRMLSQRLAKAALALDRADDEAEVLRRRAELAEVLSLWTGSHEALRRGDPARSLPGRPSAAVEGAFDQLEPLFGQMRDAASQLVRGDGERAGPLARLLEAEPGYLTRMDRIVGLFEQEARGRVDRLLGTSWAVTAVILAGLAGIGGLILRPATRLIRRQVAELTEARDVLEARVLERTRELEREASERARAEERHRSLLEQFSHVARTSTVGEMATGLAHELNQPLGAIANYAEGCLVVLDAPEPPLAEVRQALKKVLATTLRAGEVVKRIRRFVTRHESARERFEPNRLVAEVEEFFRDEARRQGIALRTDMAPDLPSLWGDPVQIQQVLVNLVRNAIESLSASKPQAPTVVMRTGAAAEGAVSFSVTDNGEGIPEDRRAKVFDAFFSTRDEGMGMGLAISRTIVETHHGTIGVESSPGVRTTFRFSLPPAGVADEGSDGLHRR